MFLPLLNKFINLTAILFTKNIERGILRRSWQNQNEKHCQSNEYLAVGMIFQQLMRSITKKDLFNLVTLKLYEFTIYPNLANQRETTVCSKKRVERCSAHSQQTNIILVYVN